MKSLRNVAVRMRPTVPALEKRSESQPLHAAKTEHSPPIGRLSQATANEAPAQAAAINRAPRRIWEFESEVEAQHLVAAPTTAAQTTNAVLGVPSRRRTLTTSPSPSPDSAAPAKTRILGFHSKDLQRDALAIGEGAAAAPRFPAGWLVVIGGPGRGAHFAVTTSVSSIGRGHDQDVALDFGDNSISRSSHAAVVYDGEQNRFFIGQGNKANVVRRNGQPVLATEEFFHGDLIRLGTTTLRFAAFCGADFTWDETDPDVGANNHG